MKCQKENKVKKSSKENPNSVQTLQLYAIGMRWIKRIVKEENLSIFEKTAATRILSGIKSVLSGIKSALLSKVVNIEWNLSLRPPEK